ncbi:hypothetical protein GUITHDRAFT_157458 [Guillardia theta CCMP2712]|uniref:Uncharacterized protein n=2 Tax=Guillardia theta TaxID=55529 RepID=L1JKQ2_GUITC|nr:hypothetical protein GUITHDRAFT_157458 [Guillardia theta CCMP2712]EKX49103.1 hypothetical protein GUITHDRAFT_157458 [Guillardia theta CCMP2712]|eukprot:XP_005836083.1 hypothetical protein GUITHDRAFT_157458 [Guillardia theta CCMP2712]
MGIMGIPMAKNLLKAGYSVTVWNRSPEKCVPLVECGAQQANSPAEVVNQCDVTFAMLADPKAAKDVVYGTDDIQGVLSEIKEGKAYVDVSTVSDDCSRQICASIKEKGGRFLEAPVSGSKKPAEDGTLIFLCAGDKSLYDEVLPALNAMGKKSVFLGEVGAGAKMKLVVNMIMTSMLSAFSEGMALASSTGLQISDLLDVVDSGAIASPMFKLKGPLMNQGKYDPAFPLKHARKDINLALLLASQNELELPVSAAASQQYLKAEAKGAGGLDFSAVHRIYQDHQS